MKVIRNLLLSLMFVSSPAFAGWIFTTDADPLDDAVNPGPANVAPAGPANQNPASVQTWLEDLVDAPAGSLTLLDSGNNTPDVLDNLDVLGAVYIVLHYGNYQGELPDGFTLPLISRGQGMRPTTNINIAFSCDSDCNSFDPLNKGLSNYRIYGTTTSVTGPGGIALMLAGLAALGLRRKLAV